MKNILILSLVIVGAFTPFSFTKAAESISVNIINTEVSQHKATFDVEITEINKILDIGSTRFDFKTVNIVNGALIDHWKIRVYCEDNIKVTVGTLAENSCGKALQTANTANNNFSVSLFNSTGKTVGFSFKLKAYDKNGTWIHSEKESFRWK